MQKPALLYHGSTQKNLKELTPRTVESGQDRKKPLLFATPELPLALIFISREIRECGMFNDVPYAVIRNSREEYEAQDKGGSVYEVHGEGFVFDPSRSMREHEWYSDHPVKPLREIDYASCLEGMLQHGVQVFFVNNDEFRQIKDSTDHGHQVLSGLVSENKRRNFNYRTF